MRGPPWYGAILFGSMVIGSCASVLFLYRLAFELVAQRPMVFDDWVSTVWSITIVPLIAFVVHAVGYRTLTGRWPQ